MLTGELKILDDQGPVDIGLAINNDDKSRKIAREHFRNLPIEKKEREPPTHRQSSSPTNIVVNRNSKPDVAGNDNGPVLTDVSLEEKEKRKRRVEELLKGHDTQQKTETTHEQHQQQQQQDQQHQANKMSQDSEETQKRREFVKSVRVTALFQRSQGGCNCSSFFL